MRRRDIPNLISLLRLLLVPPIVVLLLQREFGWALLLFFLAGASDGLDGFLAKRYGWQSELGGFLDPLADKLLMVSCVVVVAVLGLVPVWLATVILLRDLVIVGGAISYRLLIGPFQAAPTMLSKINTGVQLILLVSVLAAEWAGFPLSLSPLFQVALVMALASGVDYVLQWSRRARQARAGRPG